MILSGSGANLFVQLRQQHPGLSTAPAAFRPQLLGYQQLALYSLATRYNQVGAKILEIGTGQGASALMLSRAAPRAQIISLTSNLIEAKLARTALRNADCNNVEVIGATSWEYLAEQSRQWDMVFVDGDHNQIRRDLVAWEQLKPGGLLVCHDYSPDQSAHPSPVVFAALNEFCEQLGRDFDVKIIDETQTGMAGWYK